MDHIPFVSPEPHLKVFVHDHPTRIQKRAIEHSLAFFFFWNPSSLEQGFLVLVQYILMYCTMCPLVQLLCAMLPTSPKLKLSTLNLLAVLPTLGTHTVGHTSCLKCLICHTPIHKMADKPGDLDFLDISLSENEDSQYFCKDFAMN